MKRPVEDGLSILVGAGLGIGLMYLLDPSEGSARRAQLQGAARERLSQAGDAASAGLEHLHNVASRAAQTPALQALVSHAASAAKDAYNHLNAHADAVVSQATDTASDLKAKVSDHVDALRGKAQDLKDEGQSRYGKWLNKTSLTLGRDEDHHYIGQTACALGSLAIGAGAVYFMDPELGSTRRSKVVSGTTTALRETGEFFRRAGRRLVTRGRLVAQDAAEHATQAVAHFRNSDEPSDQAAVDESRQASMGT